MKTFKEIETLLVGKYRIHIPERVFPMSKGASVKFNSCIKDYNIVDKKDPSIAARLTPYQIEKVFEENIFTYEDEYGKIVLLKMKEDYKVELIEENK